MQNKINILLAEDEPSLGKIIKESLETRNFKVVHCLDGNQAYDTFLAENPDIVVLDIMMPKKDGFEVAKAIRKIDYQIPIIFLTAKSQTEDVIKGFNIGGNDYIRKPFSMEELIVRIQALLKRTPKKNNQIPIGKYIFNKQKQTLAYKHKIHRLTGRESALLFELFLKKNEVLERTYILNKLWQNVDFFSARSMDVFISKLRKKLSDDTNIQIINVRGYGYKLTF